MKLDHIIEDLGLIESFTECYEKREFFINNSRIVEKVSNGFSLSEFEELLWLAGNLKPTAIQISKNSNEKDKKEIESNDILRIATSSLRNGSSVVVNYAEEFSPFLAKVTRFIGQYFTSRVYSSVFLTPPHSSCFLSHTDGIDVIAAQLEGSKQWVVEEGPIALANRKHTFIDLEFTPKKREYELKSGCLLYVPRGMIHKVLNNDSAFYSLHISFGIHSVRRTDVLGKAIEIIEEEDQSYRETMSGSLSEGHFPTSDDTGILIKSFEAIADNYLLRQASALVNAEKVATLCQLPSTHLINTLEFHKIRLETVLIKFRHMPCEVVIYGSSDEVGIAFPGTSKKEVAVEGLTISAPNYIQPLFQYIQKQNDRFTVESLPGLISSNSKILVATKLVEAGLLKVLHS